MPNDPREILLEDLEVSIRTAGVLAELPVKTVGELLELSTIRATRLSLMELRQVFDALGVEYSGTLEPDEPTVELVEATGDVAERWNTIAVWLGEHHPGVLEGFRPPTKSNHIQAAERDLGLELPEDFKRFLEIHNGQSLDEPMVWTCSLLPVESLPERHRELSELYEEEETPVPAADVAPEVRPIEFSERWIPIGVSARGRDFLCLDLDPSPKGRKGQVILIAIDSDAHLLIAPSFAELLSVYFTQVQRGEIEVDG